MAAKVLVQSPGAKWHWSPVCSITCAFASQGLVVLQAILIARNLGPGGRGELGLIQLVPPLLSVFAGLGLTQALGALVPRNLAGGPGLFWASFRFSAIASVALVLVAGITFMLTAWPSPELSAISILFLLITPIEMLHSLPRDYLIPLKLYFAYDMLRLTQGLVTLAAIGALALMKIMTPVTVTLALLAAALMQAAISWGVAGAPLRQSVSPVDQRQLLRFGVICMISGFAAVFQARIFQYLIGTQRTVEELGLFIVAITWGGLGAPLWQVAQVRLYPIIAKAHGEGKGTMAFRRAAMIGVGVCAVAAMVGSTITPWLFPIVLGKEFAGGVTLAALFALVMPLQSYASLLGFGLRALGRPTQALWIDYIAAGSAVILAVVLSIYATSLTVYGWAILAGNVIAIGVAYWLGVRRDTQAGG